MRGQALWLRFPVTGRMGGGWVNHSSKIGFVLFFSHLNQIKFKKKSKNKKKRLEITGLKETHLCWLNKLFSKIHKTSACLSPSLLSFDFILLSVPLSLSSPLRSISPV